MDIIFENLDWLFYGVIIGLFVPTILLVGNKIFGLSSSLIHICSIILPKNKTKILLTTVACRTQLSGKNLGTSWPLSFHI